MNIKDLLNTLFNRIVELELKVKELEKERNQVQRYLLSHNIILTYYSERIESRLDDGKVEE